MINKQEFFAQSVENNLKSYNVRKIAVSQGDDYTIGLD